MNIWKGIALILFFISLGCHDHAEAGFASKLADTHRFRLSFAGGTMRRDMGCSIAPNPYVSTWDEPYGFIRAGYGIADRLRVSLDVFGFRQRSDLVDMIALFGAFGASVQGTIIPLGHGRNIDASVGFWEMHYSSIYDQSSHNYSEEEIGIGRSVSIVVRQSRDKSVGYYGGLIHNHVRDERPRTP